MRKVLFITVCFVCLLITSCSDSTNNKPTALPNITQTPPTAPTPAPTPTPIPSPTPPPVPNTPAKFTAIPLSSTRIDLHWTDTSNDEVGFKIERSNYDIDRIYEEIAIVGKDVNTYSDNDLVIGTSYYYRIRSYNLAGNSPYGNPSYATTFSGIYNTTHTPAPTYTPYNVPGTDLLVKDMSVSWYAVNSAYIVDFKICYKGTANLVNVQIGVFINNVHVKDILITSLSPDSCSSQQSAGTFTFTGQIDTIKICADPHQNITEVNELNNCSVRVFPPPATIITPPPSRTPAADENGGCFIATSAFGNPNSDSNVQTLRNIRDTYLIHNHTGSGLVSLYYQTSPSIAEFIDNNPALKPFVRFGLLPAVFFCDIVLNISIVNRFIIAIILIWSFVFVIFCIRRNTIFHCASKRDNNCG